LVCLSIRIIVNRSEAKLAKEENKEELFMLMPIMLMPNTRYIVTKSSDDETFIIGDQITLNEEGVILNHTARGWIDAKEVADAMFGLEVKIDKDYYETLKINLENQLMRINTKLLLAENKEGSL
jgi:hypothetical protein